jgi:phospholipid-binding lipoprotein MlaA
LSALARGARALAFCAIAVLGGRVEAAPSGALEDEGWADGPVVADPWEPLNRRLFALNLRLYDSVLEPAFRFYTGKVPEDAQRALRNLVDTARQPFSALASASTGDWALSRDYLHRFGVNAVFGLLGTLDVASEIGVPQHEPFTVGDVLCDYAVPPGPYLVLPFFGPSNLRGAAGRVGDIALGVYALADYYPIYIAGAHLQGYEKISAGRRALDDALDSYAMGRAAFAQLDRTCGPPK